MGVHTAEAINLIHDRPGLAREVARQIGFTHIKQNNNRPILTGLGMTRRQQELLDFIQGYTADNDGVCPSFEEMKQALGLASKAGIHRLIVALEERGLILRMPNRARCIILAARQ